MTLTKDELKIFRRAKRLGGKTIKVSRSGEFGVKIGKIPNKKYSEPIVLNLLSGNLFSVIRARKSLARRHKQ